MRLVSSSKLACLATAAFCLTAGAAEAGTLTETYEAPGVQDVTVGGSPAICAGATTSCVYGEETFTGAAGGGFSASFANNAITATYSGSYSIVNANIYGGAGGVGQYITTSANPGYTVTLTNSAAIPGVNYFGMWLSALDLGNSLTFTLSDGSTVTYGPANLIAAVGSCSGANPYCGNPNTGFGTNNQQYVFINFFDTTGYIKAIQFNETCCGGFESDNDTFGYLNPINPFGNYVPEPASLAILGFGVIALAAGRKNFFLKKEAKTFAT